MANAALVLAALLVASLGSTAAADRCDYDRAEMLSLDLKAFDQDLSAGGGGWRSVAKTKGCELASAQLIASYRARHRAEEAMLWWHEGQLRAIAGQYRRAIPLLKKARKQQSQDPVGWNHYVDATVSFLRRDRAELRAARARLAAVQYSSELGLPTPVNGYMNLPAENGLPPLNLRWPPNIDVVDGLLACFDKPYAQAYATPCRALAN